MTATTTLTAQQASVLRFIVRYWRANHRAPSIREFMAEFGWASQNAPLSHLKALERKGFIRVERGDRKTGRRSISRSIDIVGMQIAMPVEVLEAIA